jgi:tetratricopeptide (TPR) repeat protein
MEAIMGRMEDVENWVEKATGLYRKRDFIPAEQLLDRALRIVPDHEGALLQLGLLYVSRGMGPQALRRLQRAQSENPDSPGPYRAIATLIRISGHLEIGIRYFQSLIGEAEGGSRFYLHLGLAEIYAAQGKHAELKEQIGSIDFGSVPEPLALALLLTEAGDSAGLARLAPTASEEEIRLTLLGMAAEARGDLAAASGHYFNASNLDSPPWIAYNALAAMWLNSGNLDACKTYLAEAEKLAPNTSEVQITRARYLSARGKREEARGLLAKVMEGPGNFSKVRSLAETLIRQV